VIGVLPSTTTVAADAEGAAMVTCEKNGPTVMSGRAKEPPDWGPGVETESAGTSVADKPVFSTEAKRFATLRAKCALAGWSLIEPRPASQPAAFLATRWGMARSLPDLDAVEAFLEQIGAGR
jgi:hypothetical protein